MSGVSRGEIRNFVSKLMDEPIPQKNVCPDCYRDNLGRKVWYLQSELAKQYGCGACQPAADLIFNGGHEMVNLKTGKDPYDRKKFAKFLGFAVAMGERGDVLKSPAFKQALQKARHLGHDDEVAL